MKKIRVFLLLLSLLCITNQIMAKETNDFAFDFFSQVTKDKNIVFSPLSINQAFSIIYPGTANNTANQLQDVFYFNSREDRKLDENISNVIETLNQHESVEILMNNATWIDERLKVIDSYFDFLQEKSNTEIFLVNYSKDNDKITDEINKYIDEKTKGNIKKILETPVEKDSGFVVVNVIYFNAEWETQFNKEATQKMDFNLNNNETIPVQMMSQNNVYDYFENDMIQLIELPYANNQLSMIIILPKEKNNLESLEKEFSYENYIRVLDEIYLAPIDLYLPKFEYAYEIDLKETLQSMGLLDIFSQAEADFSLMVEPNGVNPYISFAKHKAVIKVEEDGTEAAAVSVGGGCFLKDTLVNTKNGYKKISDINIGESVISYNFNNRCWSEDVVTNVNELITNGNIFTIEAGETEFQATGNHPIFVVFGENLDLRARPNDIPEDENFCYSSGRWVETKDLELGDVIFSQNGQLKITNISKKWVNRNPVYNLSLKNFHNYSITSLGVLVHNKASAEQMSLPMIVDHPFYFIIRESSTNAILFMGKVVHPNFKTVINDEEKKIVNEAQKSFWKQILRLFQ